MNEVVLVAVFPQRPVRRARLQLEEEVLLLLVFDRAIGPGEARPAAEGGGIGGVGGAAPLAPYGPGWGGAAVPCAACGRPVLFCGAKSLCMRQFRVALWCGVGD